MTEEEYLLKIDESIATAGRILDLEDIAALAESDPEAYEDQWEARYHCGTCTVRTVMETVWPAVETYIKALQNGDVHASHS